MTGRAIARGALGVAAGYALWRVSWRAEATVAAALLNALLHPSALRVGSSEGIVSIASTSGRALGTVRFDLLTFNLIALCALFAATLTLRRMLRFFYALIALFLVHVYASC